jgi:hypothetical protein
MGVCVVATRPESAAEAGGKGPPPAPVPATAARMVDVTAGDLTARAVPWVSSAMASSTVRASRGRRDTCRRLVVVEAAVVGGPGAAPPPDATAPRATMPARGTTGDRVARPTAAAGVRARTGARGVGVDVAPPSRLSPGKATGVVNRPCVDEAPWGPRWWDGAAAGVKAKAGTGGGPVMPRPWPWLDGGGGEGAGCASIPGAWVAAGGSAKSGLTVSPRVWVSMWSW